MIHEFSINLVEIFCIKILQVALVVTTPVIFNDDQGGQFTRGTFTGVLIDSGIKISMNGRGRALDNIFVERVLAYDENERVYLYNFAFFFVFGP